MKKKFIFISKAVYFKKLKTGNLKRKAGVNFSGKKTIRGRGFINKQKKRFIDHFRCFWHVKGWILNFEYDPKKRTLVNLILYFNGLFSYLLSIENTYIGMIIQNGLKIKLFSGSSTILKLIPKNLKICNIEPVISSGSKLVRASSSSAKIISKNKKYSTLRLTSKKIKNVNNFCMATIGSILNFNFYLKKYKNAGLSRTKGFRPKVRGVAMNPVDHPHGGGEGKKSKKSNPMNPWGKALKFKKKNEKR